VAAAVEADRRRYCNPRMIAAVRHNGGLVSEQRILFKFVSTFFASLFLEFA